MKPKFKLAAFTLCAWAAGGAAYAGGATGGATLPEQVIQEATLAEQLVQQALTASNSIKNLTSGFSGVNALQGWQVGQITAQLSNLVSVIAQAQGVSYTAQNTAQQVKAAYGDPTQAITNYQQQVGQWTANLNSQIAQVLQQYQMNANDFQTQQQALNAIEQHSQTASGTMDLMQAGNQISGMMVTQIQKLQSDIQAGNQLMANYVGQEANMQAHRSDALQNWLAGNGVTAGSTTTANAAASGGSTASTGSTASGTATPGTTTASTGSGGGSTASTGSSGAASTETVGQLNAAACAGFTGTDLANCQAEQQLFDAFQGVTPSDTVYIQPGNAADFGG